jgi:uncharacterized protein
MMLTVSAPLLSACRNTVGATEAGGTWCKQDYLQLTGRVVDQANVLPPEAEANLTTKLADLERKTGHQLVIATTPSLQGKSIDDYSLCLARHWGVGRKDANDGVMMLVAPLDRKVRIEVGYGLEAALRDDEANVILKTDVLPAFTAGDFPRGIAAGTDAIIREIS